MVWQCHSRSLWDNLLCNRYWHLPTSEGAVGSTGHHKQDLSITMANYTCHKSLRRDRSSKAAPGTPGVHGAWACCLQALCYSVTPPANRKNSLAELPLSAIMVLLGSAIRTACACGNKNQIWDGSLCSHICREGCPLELSMYLMGMLQSTMAKAAEYVFKSVLQCLLYRNAAGPELASLAGAARQEELPPALCLLVPLCFSR